MAGEISPEELVRALERGEPFQVLDIRAPQRLQAGRIDVLPDERFHNVPGSRLMALADLDQAGLHRRLPVAVVCAQGLSSRPIAELLRSRGFDARSLAGGMAAWMHALVARELPPPAGFDRLLQLDRAGKGSLSYLLAADGEALLVDPPRRAQPLLAAARELGVRITALVDTHVHADYISGGPALARELGVPYHLHPADAVYPYDGTPGRLSFAPLGDGTTIQVGRNAVRVEATPGHTEGSVTLHAGDGPERAAFTGDFLFVRSLGRPDLAGKTEAWTALLWQSLERARSRWPREVAIYPAHYSSAAERRGDWTVGARLAELAATNEPFAILARDAFTAWIARRAGSFPEAYRTIKAINVGLLEVDAATADELEAGRNECALA